MQVSSVLRQLDKHSLVFCYIRNLNWDPNFQSQSHSTLENRPLSDILMLADKVAGSDCWPIAVRFRDKFWHKILFKVSHGQKLLMGASNRGSSETARFGSYNGPRGMAAESANRRAVSRVQVRSPM